MIAFAAPAALIALVALAVPIVLHLWSRLTGKPVRVGTVAWFAAAPPPVSRRPKIEDFWLLLLRCGILAALALALAEPYWRSETPARSNAVWALVASDVAADSSAAPLIDSLRSTGADVRVLEPGPIWSLLREADYEAPIGTRFVVVARNRGAEGERPMIRAEVSWVTPLERGVCATCTSLVPLTPSPKFGDGDLRRESRGVVVYSDATHRDDAKYLTAALRVAGEATGELAAITQRDAGTLGAEAEWIVWLADQPVPEPILEQTRRGATLLSYADADSSSPLSASRRGGQGVRLGLGRHLTFSTRFHPSFSDFVLQPAFPESVTVLWAGSQPEPLRPIARSQLLPARATARGPLTPARRDLYHVFWLTAVLLFLAERVLARRARAVTA